MRGAARGEVGEILVHAANVAVGRFRGDAEFGGGEFRGLRLEKGALQHYRRRAGRDAASLAAHHAGHGIGLFRVANHQHRGVEDALDAVESCHLLAFAGIAHDNRAVFQGAVVESVERLA